MLLHLPRIWRGGAELVSWGQGFVLLHVRGRNGPARCMRCFDIAWLLIATSFPSLQTQTQLHLTFSLILFYPNLYTDMLILLWIWLHVAIPGTVRSEWNCRSIVSLQSVHSYIEVDMHALITPHPQSPQSFPCLHYHPALSPDMLSRYSTVFAPRRLRVTPFVAYRIARNGPNRYSSFEIIFESQLSLHRSLCVEADMLSTLHPCIFSTPEIYTTRLNQHRPSDFCLSLTHRLLCLIVWIILHSFLPI